MANGKKFQYAQQLRLHNTAVNKLLSENMQLVPNELKDDAEAVIEHYTIWTGKWDDLNNEMKPSPTDVFVFENEHRFPKAAAQNIEKALHDLLAEKEEGSR
jgi:hypothetical protein